MIKGIIFTIIVLQALLSCREKDKNKPETVESQKLIPNKEENAPSQNNPNPGSLPRDEQGQIPIDPTENLPDSNFNTPLPWLQQQGGRWVDPLGQQVDLVGTNLGNWLLLESWMMETGGIIHDQCSLEATLSSRFGHGERERLMDVFRDSWMTERDWDLMAEFEMNVVRIPFRFNLIEDETRPYNLREDAWQHLDWAIDQAEKRGMYVILDLHGTVGSQGVHDHSGCAGRNELWGSEVFRDRTKWLWDKIATRYKDRSAIAAYGLLNEPWGTDANTMADFISELYHVVRKKDPRHIILLHGHNSGIGAFGHPKDRGMDANVGFEMHFYPGLWGWGQQDYQTHNRWLSCEDGGHTVCQWQDRLTNLDAVFLVGEFQPWTITGSHGGALGALTVNTYKNLGWASSNWSYKTINKSGTSGEGTHHWPWGMVTNPTPFPAPYVDFNTASVAEIETMFRGFATVPLMANKPLLTSMTEKNNVPGKVNASQYIHMSGIQTEAGTESLGQINLSHLDNQDWVSYEIDVKQEGFYQVNLRVASASSGGSAILSQEGKDLGPEILIPNTGGWQNWSDVEGDVYLKPGRQNFSVWVEKGGWNLAWLRFDRK